MIATLNTPSVDTIHFDAVLAGALVLCWDDLILNTHPGSIHAEYHVEPFGSVEFIKVWTSITRGYWDLVCEHWMHSGALVRSGIRFANGYKSEGLRGMLESVMQHREVLLVGAAPGADRMIQVSQPTENEKVAAGAMMEVFRDQLAKKP